MNISEELIREIIAKVLESAVQGNKKEDPGFDKYVDPSGIIGIRTATVKCANAPSTNRAGHSIP